MTTPASPASPLTVAALDVLPVAEAWPLLESCCGSVGWVRHMLDRRPFGTADTLLAAADEVWWSLAPYDWLDAFAHHPRIGERVAAIPSGARAAHWSADEQRAAAASDAELRAALAEGNREYERRFGHIYIVCAAGRSAPELLALLQARLAHDPAAELDVAAAEQARITRLRLHKLLGIPPAAEPRVAEPSPTTASTGTGHEATSGVAGGHAAARPDDRRTAPSPGQPTSR